jgi:uncharacterized membrane protein YfcA
LPAVAAALESAAGPGAYLVVCLVALAASGLTFFSGFGLGTLLLPAFAVFFPVERAVAMTAVVHFLNNLFKLAIVGRHADRGTVIRFGLPALAAALAGAWALDWLARAGPLASYEAFGRTVAITPVKAAIGLLLFAFALLDVLPWSRGLAFDPRFLPLGGVVSGFCGGLSGMQGALRSAFLARAGLSKEAFIATGVVIACLVDLSRLSVYAGAAAADVHVDRGLVAAAVAAAWAGSAIGSRLLVRVTMAGLQRLVAALLAAVAVGLVVGLL